MASEQTVQITTNNDQNDLRQLQTVLKIIVSNIIVWLDILYLYTTRYTRVFVSLLLNIVPLNSLIIAKVDINCRLN